MHSEKKILHSRQKRPPWMSQMSIEEELSLFSLRCDSTIAHSVVEQLDYCG